MIERTEYPRPQFQRREWLALNGAWEFAFDDADEGLAKGYDTGKVALPMQINVPFSYQYEASGIGDPTDHARVWYRKTFRARTDKRALLCFNGSDYVTDVWLNGRYVLCHTGGFSPFSADVTQYLKEGENVIVVRCFDPCDPAIPRGKQSWTGEKFGCWYIPNTGIWQSVWIDWVGEDYIRTYSLTPDYDAFSISGEIVTMYGLADEAEIEIEYRGKIAKRVRFSLDGRRTRYAVRLMEKDHVDPSYAWTPASPNLFDTVIRLYRGGVCVDRAKTRFGLRKISVDNGGICLNNAPLYQRLILDQGYWKESGLTPPSVEAIRKDIEMAQAMGFNGARKHQKFEDPYFYYYAEEMGFLTWCEMPSAYDFCTEEMDALEREWYAIVEEARNFTSVICYVPLNESWGVRNSVAVREQQDLARSLYYGTKARDGSRIVSSNDGWEYTEATDLIGVHDYAYDSSAFAEKYRPERYDTIYPGRRRLMAYGCRYGGQPVLMTEFGGIAMSKDSGGENWGYNSSAHSDEEFYSRYEDLVRGIHSNSQFQGFCYTQLTDVQQEVNGLLDADHMPKFDVERIARITKNS